MSCAFDKEKLTGYFDGELDPAERSEVEQHISSCSECLRDLGEIKSAALLVRELPRLRAPRSIAEGVSREIGASGGAARFRVLRGTLLWSTAAAAALLIVVNVVYFGGMRESPSPAAASRPPVSAAPGLAYKAVESGPEDGKKAFGKSDGADRRAGEKQEALVLREAEADNREKLARRAAEKPAVNAVEEKSKSGAPPAPEAPPAPPAAAMPETAAERKAGRELKDAEKPPAAPPPAETAKKAESPKEDRNLGDVRPEAKGDGLAKGKAEGAIRGAGARVLNLTLASAHPDEARSKVMALLKKVGADAESGGGGLTAGEAATRPMLEARDKSNAARPARLTVDLTERQIADLRKEIEKEKSLLLVEGQGAEARKRLDEAQTRARAKTAAAGTGGGFAAPGAAPADPKQKEAGPANGAVEVEEHARKVQQAAEPPAKAADGLKVRDELRQQAAAPVYRVTFDFTGLDAPAEADRK